MIEKILEDNCFYVYDYLDSNSESDDEAIERCFSEALKYESRTIIFDRKTWIIEKAILISSNTKIIINNCTIKQADETFDNVFRGDNLLIDENNPYGCPLDCKAISNIKIIGLGKAIISGPEKNRRGFHRVLNEEQEMVGDFWGWRTLQISISNCCDVEISNLTFVKTRCWAISFDLCEKVYVHDLEFDSNVKNGDGIDFRSGCRNCVVENITGKTSDDTVACTALTSKPGFLSQKNYLYPMEPTKCIIRRTPEEFDVSNITIKNISTTGAHHGVIVLAANGCKVHDILIDGFNEQDGEWREATIKIYTGYGSGYTPGDIHNITVKNVKSTYADYALYCNAQVRNVLLENITHAKKTEGIKLDYEEGVEIVI